MSYFHEWIIEDVGTLSCYGKMMKKEMEKEDMIEYTYRAEEIRWSSGKKTKEHQTITKDQDQGQTIISLNEKIHNHQAFFSSHNYAIGWNIEKSIILAHSHWKLGNFSLTSSQHCALWSLKAKASSLSSWTSQSQNHLASLVLHNYAIG